MNSREIFPLLTALSGSPASTLLLRTPSEMPRDDALVTWVSSGCSSMTTSMVLPSNIRELFEPADEKDLLGMSRFLCDDRSPGLDDDESHADVVVVDDDEVVVVVVAEVAAGRFD